MFLSLYCMGWNLWGSMCMYLFVCLYKRTIIWKVYRIIWFFFWGHFAGPWKGCNLRHSSSTPESCCYMQSRLHYEIVEALNLLCRGCSSVLYCKLTFLSLLWFIYIIYLRFMWCYCQRPSVIGNGNYRGGWRVVSQM